MRNHLVFLFLIMMVLPGLACNFPVRVSHSPPEVEEQVLPDDEILDGPSVIIPATEEYPPTPTPSADNAAPISQQTDVTMCDTSDSKVVLLIEPALAERVRSGLDQFKADLCAEGISVIEYLSDFQTPPAVRAYLADLYSATGGQLAGAILIGDLPYAHQTFMTTSGADAPPEPEEVVSFQYYSDLDGIFETTADYVSPGGFEYSYNVHEGEVDWEIWIGVLPVYRGDFDATVQAIEQYLVKNHAYRVGDYSIPRAFLEVSEHFTAETMAEHDQIVGWLTDGDYSWKPFSTAPNASFYFDSAATSLSTSQGYQDMSAGVADFSVLSAHGWWGAHGQIDIDWVENHPVRTVFFWSNGCAVGNLDFDVNFLSTVLYSPTSMVLVAKGTTNNSGGMGTNQNGFFGHNVAAAMTQGHSFGDAVLSHVNVPLILPWSEERELHFATSVTLGDPTLKLRLEASTSQTPFQPVVPPTATLSAATSEYIEQPAYSGDCSQRPANSVCLSFSDGYLWLVYDSVAGSRDGGVWNGKPIEVIEGFKSDYYHVLWTSLVKEDPK